jgi:hypothetical protein
MPASGLDYLQGPLGSDGRRCTVGAPAPTQSNLSTAERRLARPAGAWPAPGGGPPTFLSGGLHAMARCWRTMPHIPQQTEWPAVKKHTENSLFRLNHAPGRNTANSWAARGAPRSPRRRCFCHCFNIQDVAITTLFHGNTLTQCRSERSAHPAESKALLAVLYRLISW